MTNLVKAGTAYGNQYTISTQGDVDAISGQQWQGIIKDYDFVISQISKRLRWQGTMDFAIDVVTGVSENGLFPAMAWQYAYDDKKQWVHSAYIEQSTGVDLNGQEPDLGFYINLSGSGQFTNFGTPVWIDPKPTLKSFKKKPKGHHDLTSIIMHETFHSLGIAYDSVGGWSNKFKDLTVTREGKNYFAGSNAVAVFGAEVPLTDMVTSNSYDHIDHVNQSGQFTTVMPRTSDANFNWRSPSSLDFAILKDIGWNVI